MKRTLEVEIWKKKGKTKKTKRESKKLQILKKC